MITVYYFHGVLPWLLHWLCCLSMFCLWDSDQALSIFFASESHSEVCLPALLFLQESFSSENLFKDGRFSLGHLSVVKWVKVEGTGASQQVKGNYYSVYIPSISPLPLSLRWHLLWNMSLQKYTQLSQHTETIWIMETSGTKALAANPLRLGPVSHKVGPLWIGKLYLTDKRSDRDLWRPI